MGSRIDHHAEFSQDVSEVFAASSDESVLRVRLSQLGGKHGGLQEHSATPDGVKFRLTQGIGAEQLPQAVRTLHKGDLIVHRAQVWTRDGDGYTGTANATVNGVPGEITARTSLKRVGSQTVLHTLGAVKVNIPLFGPKLESIIAEQVTKLLVRESEFTAKWLADNS
jgi:hypothetical protein